MTKEELAAKLNGREHGNEITQKEEAEAKAAGLVVVFGAYDDLMEFRGAIYDEYGAPNEAFILGGRVLNGPECDHRGVGCKYAQEAYERDVARALRVEALWCEEKPYSWTFKTKIPHATFDILEDGEKCCGGIVFSLADVAAHK